MSDSDQGYSDDGYDDDFDSPSRSNSKKAEEAASPARTVHYSDDSESEPAGSKSPAGRRSPSNSSKSSSSNASSAHPSHRSRSHSSSRASSRGSARSASSTPARARSAENAPEANKAGTHPLSNSTSRTPSPASSRASSRRSKGSRSPSPAASSKSSSRSPAQRASSTPQQHKRRTVTPQERASSEQGYGADSESEGGTPTPRNGTAQKKTEAPPKAKKGEAESKPSPRKPRAEARYNKPKPKQSQTPPPKKKPAIPSAELEARLAALAKPKPKPQKPSTEEARQQATILANKRVQDHYLQASKQPRPPPGGNGAQKKNPKRQKVEEKKNEGTGSSVPAPGTFGYTILHFNMEAGNATGRGDLKEAEKLLTQAYNILQKEQPVPPPTKEEVEAARPKKKRNGPNDDSESSEEDSDDKADRAKAMHQAAIDGFKAHKDPLLATTLNNLGCLYRSLRQPSKASLYLDAGVRLERSMGKPSPITLLNAAVAAIENREFTHAQDLGKEALKICGAAPAAGNAAARTRMANVKTSIRYRIADAMFQEFKANVEEKKFDDEEVMLDEADRVSDAFQKALHSSGADGGGDGSQTAFLRQESKKVREYLGHFRLLYGGEVPWLSKDDVVRLPGGLPLPPKAAAAYCRSQADLIELGMKNSKSTKMQVPQDMRGRSEFSYVGTSGPTTKPQHDNGSSIPKLPLIRSEEAEKVYHSKTMLKTTAPAPPKRKATTPMKRTRASTARQTDAVNVVAIRAAGGQSSSARRASVKPMDEKELSQRKSVVQLQESPSLSVPIDESSVLSIGKKKPEADKDQEQKPATRTPSPAASSASRSSRPSTRSSPRPSGAGDASPDPEYSDDEDQ